MSNKINKLIAYLSDVKEWETPKVALEQYPTEADTAARMMWCIDKEYDEVNNYDVADLGCGPGMLSIAAAALGAASVDAFELDEDTLDLLESNINDFELEDVITMHHCDITSDEFVLSVPDESYDLVLLNPPFGTKSNKGIDVTFLEQALRIVKPGGAVYMLFKSSTAEFMKEKARSILKGMGSSPQEKDVRCIMRFTWKLDATMSFHKKDTKDIYVDLLRVYKR